MLTFRSWSCGEAMGQAVADAPFGFQTLKRPVVADTVIGDVDQGKLMIELSLRRDVRPAPAQLVERGIEQTQLDEWIQPVTKSQRFTVEQIQRPLPALDCFGAPVRQPSVARDELPGPAAVSPLNRQCGPGDVEPAVGRQRTFADLSRRSGQGYARSSAA